MAYAGQFIEDELEQAGAPKNKNRKKAESPEKRKARMINRLREILGMEKQFADPSKLKSPPKG